MTNPTRREAFRRGTLTLTSSAAVAAAARSPRAEDDPPPLRLGIVGLDTSHVTTFAEHFNRPEGKPRELAGMRIDAAFPAGNPDFPLSIDRLERFTNEVRRLGVHVVASFDDLLARVDGVLLESVDGRQHLDQARAIFAARKPVFIDKPLAASLDDALAIAALGRRHGVPWFTASSSRFTPGYPAMRHDPDVGDILGCDVYSQSRAAPGHPDLFWYGVHGVDLLYSLMGTGCRSVTAIQTPLTEQVTGRWDGGRVGTYRGIREHTSKTGLGASVFGTKGTARCDTYYDYPALVLAIARFFRTRRSPVPEAEMIEVFSFLAAAEASKARGGRPVSLDEVMAAAAGPGRQAAHRGPRDAPRAALP